ncbi:hypothetical protein NEDG_01532 [Nematocida displodere]|uniref:RRM domain-containing protein n=1 Tax=Nematocida displodere TaxID=1805483 RepID=A0A177EDF6_9MICR|nr:hypothetical protein NEDG_01532 [Nematocida displodere]
MAIRKTANKKTEQKNIKEETASESESESEIESGPEADASEETNASEEVSGSDSGTSASEAESASSSASASEEKEASEKEEETKDDRTIFIKGISYNASEEDLQDIFGKYGAIKEIRIPKSHEGKGKGFAYIEFKNKESCEKSFEVTGTECDGRKLVVDFAKSGPRKEGGADSNNNESAPRYNNSDNGITVFLGNVPFDFEQEDLLSYLKQFAAVKDLRVPMDRDTRKPKGFAFASCDTQAEADKLISSELIFQDRTIRAQISEQKRPGNNGGAPRRDFGGRGGDFGGRGGDFGGRGGRGDRDGGYAKKSWSSENSSNKKHVKFE